MAALDDQGQRSGISDYLAAPRPFVFSDPPDRAPAGVPYRYDLKTIASIGDVRCRTIGGDLYCAAFWDADQPRFSLVRAPSWLSVDAATGVLSGVPPAEFKAPAEVTVQVDIPGAGSDRQTYTLRP